MRAAFRPPLYAQPKPSPNSPPQPNPNPDPNPNPNPNPSGPSPPRRYELYFDSTPPLWPFPPFVYRRMPLLLKRLLCFEHSPQAKRTPL